MPAPLEEIARALGVAPDGVTPQAIFDHAFPGVAACVHDSAVNPAAEQIRSHGRILLDGARTGAASYADSFNSVRTLLLMGGVDRGCGARIPAEMPGGTSLLGGPAGSEAAAAPSRAGRVVGAVAALAALAGLGMAAFPSLRPPALTRFLSGR